MEIPRVALAQVTSPTAETTGPAASRARPPVTAAAPPGRQFEPAAAPGPRRAFVEVLEVLDERQVSPAPGPGTPPSTRAPPDVAGAARRVTDLMARSFRAEDQLDRAIAAARGGQTFTPGQLLALQAEVFRHSQVVEVVSRSLDKLVGGVKQVLGTPV